MAPRQARQNSAHRHRQEHLAAAVPQQASRILVAPPCFASQSLPLTSLDRLVSPDASSVLWPQHTVHPVAQHKWGVEDSLFLPDAGVVPPTAWGPGMEDPMPVGDGHTGPAWGAEVAPYAFDRSLPPNGPNLDVPPHPDKEQLLLHSLLTSLNPPTASLCETQPLPETVRLLSALLASSPSLSESLSKVLLHGPPGLSHPAAMGA